MNKLTFCYHLHFVVSWSLLKRKETKAVRLWAELPSSNPSLDSSEQYKGVHPQRRPG